MSEIETRFREAFKRQMAYLIEWVSDYALTIFQQRGGKGVTVATLQAALDDLSASILGQNKKAIHDAAKDLAALTLLYMRQNLLRPAHAKAAEPDNRRTEEPKNQTTDNHDLAA